MEKKDRKEKQDGKSFIEAIQCEKASIEWAYNRNLIETNPDALAIIGTDGIIMDVNSAAEKDTGLSRDKIIGTDFSQYVTEPDKARMGYAQVFAIGKVVDYELYLNHIDGTSMPVLYNASVVKDPEGNVIGILAVGRNISAIKKREKEHIEFENNLELCIQQKTVELRIANKELAFQNEEKDKREAELIIANKELLFQNEEKEKRANELIIANKELLFQNEEKDKRAAELVLANKELLFQTTEKADRAAELMIADKELAFQNEEKADRAAELVIANKELAFQNEEKDKRAAELIIANKELVFQNEEISYISYHDFLTGLFNRIYFEQEKKRLDVSNQLPISLIMGDINGLKLVNDGFGHSKGDELLIEISRILKSCCRKEDIISRIGGDEFGILLPQTDSTSAQLICNRISDACNKYTLKRSSICPSISLGFATKTLSSETLENIFITAEEKMSRHKLLERKSVHSSIIASIKAIMFEKSQETEEHAERMIQLSKAIGLAMALPEGQLNELELLSTLHDIGKMGVSAEILSKQGKLSNKDWVEIRKHPEIGFRIAQATPELAPIADFILHHHERWDGKGYPQGLIGEKIPLLSRIVSIVDAFDAMTNDRAYRLAMTKEMAIEEIKKNSGTQFDPKVSRVFIEIVLGKKWEQIS